MYYVYALLLKNKDVYIGYTSDLKARIKQHQKGTTKTTRGMEPQLVYYEAFKSSKDAKERERSLKGGQSKRHLCKRIAESCGLCEHN